MKIDFRSLANSSVRELIPYQPGKPIEELERELGIFSSIKLASNENPLGASPMAIAAAKEALCHAHIYPDGSCYELKQKLARFLSVSSTQLTIGNGSENILELIIKTYLSKEDSAVISEFAFLTIPLLISSYGARANIAPANNWSHDIHAMIKAIDDRTRILFLVNPNNPTGTYTSKEDLRYLLNSVAPHILIVIDEAYFEYFSKRDYPNTLDYLSQYPNLIICRTFSKAYGLAAMRIGYSISSADIADMLNRARLPFNVNKIAEKTASAALEDQAHIIKSVQLNQAGMHQLEEGLRALQLPYIPSIANFITIDVSHASLVYQQLLYEGVIVRPLNAYHMPRHIRVTIGTPEQNDRFLQALKKVMTSTNISMREEIKII